MIRKISLLTLINPAGIVDRARPGDLLIPGGVGQIVLRLPAVFVELASTSSSVISAASALSTGLGAVLMLILASP